MKKSKLIEFTYIKDNLEVSERVGIKMGYTSPELMLVADVSDYRNEVWLVDLEEALSEIHRDYLDRVQSLLDMYDVKQKTFKVSGITNEKKILL